MKRLSIVLFSLFLLLSCAKTRQFVDYPDSSVSVTESRIYLIRHLNFGPWVKPPVYVNDEIIGRIGYKGFLKFDIQGKDIELQSRFGGFSRNDLLPGQVYFYKQNISNGLFKANMSWVEIDEKEARELLKKLKKPKLEPNN